MMDKAKRQKGLLCLFELLALGNNFPRSRRRKEWMPKQRKQVKGVVERSETESESGP
ncbi:MAG: hypothetical protein FWF99_06200 [Desulfovibrionaceae bacterium]|nr:hypothetical protein [Desulfovibrionaceae bacterium]